ncbi:MAG: lysophospholipid acyltransferase family protein [Thermodesulfobacteriota bacterium]|nr:lysophospholipid acyltransferase family protein [Thermodesulfobacteriota bacterium]
MISRKYLILWVIKLACRLFLQLFFKISIHGIENIPGKGGFILSPKHQRWEDIPLLSLAAGKPLYYIAKHELFNNFLSNWFFSSLGGIPLNRERLMESRKSLVKIIEVLNLGEGVVVFPEGTYYMNRVGPGQIGIVKLILSRLNVPFIPVGINYLRTGFRIQVKITFGKPIHAEKEMPVAMFLNILMNKIAGLSGLC